MINPAPNVITTRRLNQLQRLGLINEIRARDMVIRRDFARLKAHGIRSTRAIHILSEKQHNGTFLSFDRISRIVYTR